MKTRNSQYFSPFFKHFLGMALLFLFVNCSKNPLKCLNGSWAEEISSELETFVEASQNYDENPTIENCNSYKSSINRYIDALEGIDDCYAGITDFNEELVESREELSEIDCTDG